MGQALSIFVGAEEPSQGKPEVELNYSRVGNYTFVREKLEELNRQAVLLEEAEVARVQDLVVAMLSEPMSVTKVVRHLRETFDWFQPAILYAWRIKYPEFADAWDQAYAAGTDNLEDVAITVAKEGNASTLQFLLKQRNMERYGITRIEATGKDGADLIPRTIEVVVLEAGQQAPTGAQEQPAADGGEAPQQSGIGTYDE